MSDESAVDHEARMRGVSTSQFRLASDFVDAILRDVFQGKRDHLRGQMLDVAARVSRKHPWPYFEECVEAEVTNRLAARDAATRADERALVLGELGAVTLIEWRVRYGDGDTDGDGTREYAEGAIADARTAIAAGEFAAEDYEPMELVYRTVTTAPDSIGEWVVSE